MTNIRFSFDRKDFVTEAKLCFVFYREMASKIWILLLGILFMVSATMGVPPRKPVNVPFGRNYMPTWAFDHIKYCNGGSEIQLHLDKYTGTGFQSKGSYLFGHFSMQIKLVPGDSAGSVTAFYVSVFSLYFFLSSSKK